MPTNTYTSADHSTSHIGITPLINNRPKYK
ncbi:hypothetical protein ABID22_003898 [Pontibacter aydingkolensis]